MQKNFSGPAAKTGMTLPAHAKKYPVQLRPDILNH